MSRDILSMFNATAVSLRVPTDLRDRVFRYVRQHQGGALIAEQAPFRRQLDLWAVGVAVACARGLSPRAGSSGDWGSKFVDTRSVQLSAELAQLLVVIAAADFGIQDARVSDPKEVMELANRYAGAGMPIVLEWLEDPGLRQTNIEKVLVQLRRAKADATAASGIGGRPQESVQGAHGS